MAILAFSDPTYQPAMRIINAITNANPAAITTSFAHDYITGTIVRFVVPDGYGMKQLNKLYGVITVTGATTFTVSIDTTHFDTFVIPGSYPESYQHAQVTPIGEINSLLTGATENVL